MPSSQIFMNNKDIKALFQYIIENNVHIPKCLYFNKITATLLIKTVSAKKNFHIKDNNA